MKILGDGSERFPLDAYHFCVFPCSIPRCMASFVGLVLLIQAGLNISIRTHRLTLKEVRL